MTEVTLKLLNCPFCGKRPHIEDGRNDRPWVVQCYNRDCRVQPFIDDGDTKAHAIAGWNGTRPASTEPADALAAENALLRAEIEERDEWTAIVDKMPLDAFDRLGDYWVQRHCTVHLIQAITSVFSRYADENIMARFRQSITDNLHLAFVEGCIAGSRNALTRTDALAEAREALDQALDDMGDDGKCVCQATKNEMIAALSRLNAGDVK